MCVRTDETVRAIRIWDRLARYYDVVIAPLERISFRAWRRRTLDALPRRGLLLEVGAGTGLNFEHYAADARGVATELSLGMLVRASARQRPAGIRLVVADVQRLPFRDETFDAVLATLVFCSVPDDDAGFAEVGRVLRDDGRFAGFEHVRPAGLVGRLFDRLNRLTVAAFGDHINRTPAESLRRAGLTVDRVSSGEGSVLQAVVANRARRVSGEAPRGLP